MFKRLLLLSLPFMQIHSLPTQSVSLEEIEERSEEELEMSQESLFNEEEEISVIPKQGSRPQVVQIPSKTQ